MIDLSRDSPRVTRFNSAILFPAFVSERSDQNGSKIHQKITTEVTFGQFFYDSSASRRVGSNPKHFIRQLSAVK